uniref:hypothetical protein n=1 Tax=Streptosporangium sp. CA-235898 TaxID=3240073 RepID=UPI003F4947C5
MTQKRRGDRRTRTLHTAVRHELLDLWHDMYEARRHANRGCWSGACESLERRIKALTPFVGPPNWRHMQIEMLEQGIYQRFHADMGYTVAPDMAVVAEMRAERDRSLAEIASPAYLAEYEADKAMREQAMRDHWKWVDAMRGKS